MAKVGINAKLDLAFDGEVVHMLTEDGTQIDIEMTDLDGTRQAVILVDGRIMGNTIGRED
jgi:hypothetical protein